MQLLMLSMYVDGEMEITKFRTGKCGIKVWLFLTFRQLSSICHTTQSIIMDIMLGTLVADASACILSLYTDSLHTDELCSNIINLLAPPSFFGCIQLTLFLVQISLTDLRYPLLGITTPFSPWIGSTWKAAQCGSDTAFYNTYARITTVSLHSTLFHRI